MIEPASDDEPDRDTWVTPRKLARDVGPWDLDPCSNSRSHILAKRQFDLERRGEDGLVLARYVSARTRVWCNPPYSHGNVIRWVRAYRHTRFCFLLRLDPSTMWFAELWPYAHAMCFLRLERVAFEPPPGLKVVGDNHNNPFPHALIYAHADDITPAVRRACYVLINPTQVGAT